MANVETNRREAVAAAVPAGRGRRLSWRHAGWALVALVTLGFVLLHRGEWRKIGGAAREADIGALLLAALLQCGWMAAFGATFWGSYRAAGVPLPFGRTLAISWAANFVNMVVKSGGMGGMALFLRAAGRRGHSRSRATVAYLLTIALGYAGFLLLLAGTLALLWWNGDLRRLELVSAAATFVFLVGMMATAAFVVQSPLRVRRAYRLIARAANSGARVLRRGPLLDPDAGERAGGETAEGYRLVRRHPARLLPAVGATLAKEAVAVAVMYAVLQAFDAPASLSLALTAYTLTILFSYVSIVPSGLGVVELSLTALLIRVGIDAAPAALTTLVYRLFQFWTPFLVGAAATRFMGRGEMADRSPTPGPSLTQ